MTILYGPPRPADGECGPFREARPILKAAQALADALLRRSNNEGLRWRIASGGRIAFRQQCATRTLGLRFTDILNEVIGKRAIP